MPINRDEVATMIIDALSTLESHRRSFNRSELYGARERRPANETRVDERLAQMEAHSFDSLMRRLHPHLSQLHPAEFGWTVSKKVIVVTEVDSDVTRVILDTVYEWWSKTEFEFPPNDPRFLEEIRRAQNHGLYICAAYHRNNENALVIESLDTYNTG